MLSTYRDESAVPSESTSLDRLPLNPSTNHLPSGLHTQPLPSRQMVGRAASKNPVKKHADEGVPQPQVAMTRASVILTPTRHRATCMDTESVHLVSQEMQKIRGYSRQTRPRIASKWICGKPLRPSQTCRPTHRGILLPNLLRCERVGGWNRRCSRSHPYTGPGLDAGLMQQARPRAGSSDAV